MSVERVRGYTLDAILDHELNRKLLRYWCLHYNYSVTETNPAQHAPLGRGERCTGASMQKLIRLHHFIRKQKLVSELPFVFIHESQASRPE